MKKIVLLALVMVMVTFFGISLTTAMAGEAKSNLPVPNNGTVVIKTEKLLPNSMILEMDRPISWDMPPKTKTDIVTRDIKTSGRGVLIQKIEAISEVRAADIGENKILVVFDKSIKKCDLDKVFARLSILIGEQFGASQINWD